MQMIDLSNELSSSEGENEIVATTKSLIIGTPLKPQPVTNNLPSSKLDKMTNLKLKAESISTLMAVKPEVNSINFSKSSNQSSALLSLRGEIHALKKILGKKEQRILKQSSTENVLKKKIKTQEKELIMMETSLKRYIQRDKNRDAKIKALRKINQTYVQKMLVLEKKYNELKRKQQIKPRDRLESKESRSYNPQLSRPPEEKEMTLNNKNVEDEYDRSLQAAIEASMIVNSPVVQKKSDIRLEEEINFTMELSKKEDEIRKQREHAIAIEELYKSNLDSERAVKRKLKTMECEKEKATKRLKIVEQEKEQLVDELECTTLCGFCEEKKKDTAFEPCGHIWACEDCVKKAKMKHCPNCREEIKNVRKVFIS